MASISDYFVELSATAPCLGIKNAHTDTEWYKEVRSGAGADFFIPPPAQTVDSCSPSVTLVLGDYTEGHAH